MKIFLMTSALTLLACNLFANHPSSYNYNQSGPGMGYSTYPSGNGYYQGSAYSSQGYYQAPTYGQYSGTTYTPPNVPYGQTPKYNAPSTYHPTSSYGMSIERGMPGAYNPSMSSTDNEQKP